MAKLVHCSSISEILWMLDVKRVDFFSLDVEGSEDLVLSTVDLDRVEIPLLLVESINRLCPPRNCSKREAVRKRMASHGYELNPIKITKSDVFWRPDLLPNFDLAKRMLIAATSKKTRT